MRGHYDRGGGGIGTTCTGHFPGDHHPAASRSNVGTPPPSPLGIRSSRLPPEADPAWEAGACEFLADRRRHVLADIRATLARPAAPLASRLNFAPWEAGVLARVGDPEGCQRLTLDRRGAIDADAEDREEARGTLVRLLRARGHDPETAHVRIAKSEVAAWLAAARREPIATSQATAMLRLHGIDELREHRSSSGGEWIWNGARAVAEQAVPIDKAKPPTGG